MRARRPGSRLSATSARDTANGSRLVPIPASSFPIKSATPPTAGATIGRPHAAASWAARQKVSYAVGRTKMSAPSGLATVRAWNVAGSEGDSAGRRDGHSHHRAGTDRRLRLSVVDRLTMADRLQHARDSWLKERHRYEAFGKLLAGARKCSRRAFSLLTSQRMVRCFTRTAALFTALRQGAARRSASWSAG